MSNTEADPRDIEFVANKMLVGGQQMRARELRGRASGERRVDAEEVGERLRLGRFAILRTIEEEWLRNKAREEDPDVEIVRPPIQVVRLGSIEQQPKVIREVGRGIIENKSDVYDRFHPYWDAVNDNGFTPEVRMLAGGSEPTLEGPWLYLRKPELDKVAAELGFRDTKKLRQMRSAFEVVERSGGQLTLGREWLREYRIEGEEIIDAMPDDYEQRARAQIALILLCAERRRNLGDIDGFMEEIQDALLYAQNLDDPALVTTIENGGFMVHLSPQNQIK